MIIMGTALAVSPFNMLSMKQKGVDRLILNRGEISLFDKDDQDLIVDDDCDKTIKEIVEGCGWSEKLDALMKK